MRMKRNTFNTILNMLGPRLVRQNSIFRDCLPSSVVLGIGIYRLAHGNSYVSMAPTFCVGKSTAIEAIQDVVEALYDIRHDHIKVPETQAEVEASIQTFDDLSSLPNIVGAIDGSHVTITAPVDSKEDYFSRYQEYDFIIQGVVNGQQLFIDFACGFPGSMHDVLVDFFWYFSTTLLIFSLLFISRAIEVHAFHDSLLSISSCFDAHRLTSNFCSSLLHLSYVFLGFEVLALELLALELELAVVELC